MKIVIATGGTGGHLFPAMALANELRSGGHSVTIVGHLVVALKRIQAAGFSYENIFSCGFDRQNPIKCLHSLKCTVVATYLSLKYLKKTKPAVVVGFGGYSSFHTVLSSVLLGIPTMIHEQNVVPGLANKVLALFSKKIAISFKKSQEYFKKDKVVFTGFPVNFSANRVDKDVIFNSFGLQPGRKTLLVFGGSQGSHKINMEFLQMMKFNKDDFEYQVIHICGHKDYAQLKTEYDALHLPVALFEFLDRIEQAYAVSDLVIARSGAATVMEIAHFKIPAIFIPYPYAGGHQKNNASVLSEAGLATIIDQSELTAETMKMAIAKKMNQFVTKETVDQLEELIKKNSVQVLAQEVIQIANE